MKTKEDILIEFGCPEVQFDEDVTMYYPAILSAMEEYAQQYNTINSIKKQDIEVIVRQVVENTWYNRRSINPVEEQTEEITTNIYNKLMKLITSGEKQTCKCDNRHVVYSLKTDKPHCINCHKDIAEEEQK